MEPALGANVRLNNGHEMPVLGLGVWKMSVSEAKQAVLHALRAGYRHIDTAALYGNERGVGEAIKESGIPREEIFVTTKLWYENHFQAEKELEKSLDKLGLDYVDLYLMHWPELPRIETWKKLEKTCEQGKCRAIGVSNFTITHLQELLSQCNIVPVVNQVEFHPWLYQKELLEYCKRKGIVVEAYSPLTHGKKLGDARLEELAKKYGKSPAQILIRWALQHGTVPLPKSKSPERISENAQVFDFQISPEDMKQLNAFHQNLRTCWDPTEIP